MNAKFRVYAFYSRYVARCTLSLCVECISYNARYMYMSICMFLFFLLFRPFAYRLLNNGHCVVSLGVESHHRVVVVALVVHQTVKKHIIVKIYAAIRPKER